MMEIKFKLCENSAFGESDEEGVIINLGGLTEKEVDFIISVILHEELEFLIRQEVSEGWWEDIIFSIIYYIGKLIL